MLVDNKYQTPDYCLSCTYFHSTRGHFGHCEPIPDKVYDGSKKGSGCFNWRINNSLYKTITSNSLIIPPLNTQYNSLRKVYNESKKPKFKGTHFTNVDGEFISYTSDIHSKNGYYKFRYNYTLIDVTLTLFLQGKNYGDIVRHMNNNYMKPMSRRSFLYWIEKFLGKNAFYQHPYYHKFYIKIEKPAKIPKKCKINGCEGKHLAKGYCRLHYQRWKAHGDALKIVKKAKNPSLCIEAGCENKRHSNDSLCKKHGNHPPKSEIKKQEQLQKRKEKAIALLKSIGITTIT